MQKVVWISCVLGLVIAGSAVNSNNSAEARPQYFKAFAKKYTNLKAKVKKTKCFTCHQKTDDGKRSKKKNEYGAALTKLVGKKNQKDPEAIEKALTTAESKKNAKGVTFGSLIKAGKLPGGE